MWHSRLIDWLVYLAVRVVVCIAQSISLKTCNRCANGLAWIAHDVLHLRYKIVDSNLQGVFKELTPRQRGQIALAMWRHLFLMFFEIANAPRKIHRTNWRHHFDVHNNRALMELMLGARPIVMVSGHFGNFEMAGFMAGLLGFPSYTITRPLDNLYLDRYVNSFRGMHGQFIIAKQGSSGQLNRILAEGGKIAMLGDQAAGPRGCWVDFLGRPASCHKAVALFTLTSNAPLLVCYTRRKRHPLDFELGLIAAADPAIDHEHCQSVRSLTSWYNAMMEGVIRQYPEQYWWVHRRWKGQPRQRRRLARAG